MQGSGDLRFAFSVAITRVCDRLPRALGGEYDTFMMDWLAAKGFTQRFGSLSSKEKGVLTPERKVGIWKVLEVEKA